MKIYNFGIIGCGVIAHSHARGIKSIENARITSVCDIDGEKAKNFAKQYGVEKYYLDYRELIEDKDVDIVCICTPSGLHGEPSILAANAKKHIFCEKPIEITREKMDKMIEAVEKNGVKMGCVFQRRCYESSILVKKALDEGELGRIILADCYQKLYRSPEYYRSADWRGTWELDGGGALMNQAIHGLDSLIWLAGDVESVFAHSKAQVRKIEVENTAVAVLKFKNGAFGVIEGTTSVYPNQSVRTEIHGEKGTIIMTGNEITEWAIEGIEERRVPVSTKKTEMTYDGENKVPVSSHRPLLVDLIDSIENDREPMIPPREARKSVDLILAIYESSRTGKAVTLV